MIHILVLVAMNHLVAYAYLAALCQRIKKEAIADDCCELEIRLPNYLNALRSGCVYLGT